MTGPDAVIIKVAELRAGGAGAELVTLGLGSCVAIILHDAEAQVGGMAHVMLPSKSLSHRGAAQAAKFPETAVPALIEAMAALGAQPRRMSACLVGGASMFAALTPMGAVQMGERNVVASRQALALAGIPIVGEATGGTAGRSVRLLVADGSVSIRTLADGIRKL